MILTTAAGKRVSITPTPEIQNCGHLCETPPLSPKLVCECEGEELRERWTELRERLHDAGD